MTLLLMIGVEDSKATDDNQAVSKFCSLGLLQHFATAKEVRECFQRVQEWVPHTQSVLNVFLSVKFMATLINDGICISGGHQVMR